MPFHGYAEGSSGYRLRCPSGKCGDAGKFLLFRVNGSGICSSDPLPAVGGFRRYSPWGRSLGSLAWTFTGFTGRLRMPHP